MGPAEIVASLKELCQEKGPNLTTEQIVAWIDGLGGFESDAELIAFAKKMKAATTHACSIIKTPRPARESSDFGAFSTRGGVVDFTPTSSTCPTTSRKLVKQYAAISQANANGSQGDVGLLRRSAFLRLLHDRRRRGRGIRARRATNTTVSRINPLDLSRRWAGQSSHFPAPTDGENAPRIATMAASIVTEVDQPAASTQLPDALGRFGAVRRPICARNLDGRPQRDDHGLCRGEG